MIVSELPPSDGEDAMGAFRVRDRLAWFGAACCLALTGCVRFEREYYCQWLELRPSPTQTAVDTFRARFPTTPVTTTQPGSWNKIEVGMTRGMVRALVGPRLLEKDQSVATLRQEPLPHERLTVRLYFAGDSGMPKESDELKAIIVNSAVSRPMNATDWP